MQEKLLGNIKIYFGSVVDINDEAKIFRCRVSIDGLTNEIDKNDLPWYFPWYGVNYLPQLNDVVPCIVFDENFSTAFYAKKVDINKLSISDDDYANYVELFLRTIDGKLVGLTYEKSKGIVFQNDASKITIALSKILFDVDGMPLQIEKDKINIGNGTQANLMGDDTVKHLHNIIAHQNNMITQIYACLSAIATAATPNPFTLAIGTALTPLLASTQPTLVAENKKLDVSTDLLQSKKIFIG